MGFLLYWDNEKLVIDNVLMIGVFIVEMVVILYFIVVDNIDVYII